jgi:hypothetical protein
VVALIEGPPAVLAQLAAHRDWLADEILAVVLDLGGGSRDRPVRDHRGSQPPRGTLRLGVRRA